MASQSLYRKWRSQTFSDLVGQEATVRTLLNAVRDGRLLHAYLFCGPRGTGKTSAARLLAKAVNCANPHDGEPCNVCTSCREITAGHSPDVIEIDAASNTGVESIRDLRENVSLLGTGGHRKVYIIDEVHMLSTAAFNALLKTLEEPPPHVIFVLATTEAHKVLTTVVSRCQRFDFRRIGVNDIVARLHHVAEGEGLTLQPGVAELLARAAQGGLRDALSLLDQAMAFCGADIDLAHTRAMLGLTDPTVLRRLIELIAEQQAAEGLHLIHQLVTAGADLRQLTAQLSEEWRALMLASAGADVATVMDRTPEEAHDLAALASRFGLAELMACARVFARNEVPARGLPVPQLALEIAYLECLSICQPGGVAQATATPAPRASAPSPSAPPAEPRPAPVSPQPPRSAIPATEPPVLSALPALSSVVSAAGEQQRTPALDQPPRSLPPVVANAERVERVERAAGQPPVEDDMPSEAWQSTLTLDRVLQQWTLAKKVCRQKSSSVAALLNNTRPVALELGGPCTLILEAEFDFHATSLREPAKRDMVEWALGQVLGEQLRVRVVMKGSASPTTGGKRGGQGTSSQGTPPPARERSAQPQGAGPTRQGQNHLSQQNGNVRQIREQAPPTEPYAPAPASAPAPSNGSHASAAPPAPSAQPVGAQPVGAAALRGEVLADPIVQEILRTCDAELTEVLPLDTLDDEDFA